MHIQHLRQRLLASRDELVSALPPQPWYLPESQPVGSSLSAGGQLPLDYSRQVAPQAPIDVTTSASTAVETLARQKVKHHTVP